MNRFRSSFAVFRRLALYAVVFLLALSLSRALLADLYWERVAPTEGL